MGEIFSLVITQACAPVAMVDVINFFRFSFFSSYNWLVPAVLQMRFQSKDDYRK